jgi:O-antigen/teichoic acid export membrane protein
MFGVTAAASNLINVTARSLPPLIVGGVLGIVALGYYSMAYQIVRVPEIIISGPIYLSMFTAIARWGEDRTAMNSLVLRGLRSVIVILAPIFCGLMLVSDFLVQALFGSHWQATASLLVLLAPAGFLICLYSFVHAVLMGLGQSHLQLRLMLLGGSFMSIATLIGVHFSTAGGAIGLSVGTAAVAPAYVSVLAQELRTSKRVIARAAAAPISASVIMALVVISLRYWEFGWSARVVLSTTIVVGVLSFSTALYALASRSIAADLRWLASAARGPKGELF